jgi:hypothetical protein
MSSFYDYYTFQKVFEKQKLLARNSSYPAIIAENVVHSAKKADLPENVNGRRSFVCRI